VARRQRAARAAACSSASSWAQLAGQPEAPEPRA
jgi:hypothetical protein